MPPTTNLLTDANGEPLTQEQIDVLHECHTQNELTEKAFVEAFFAFMQQLELLVPIKEKQ